MDHGDLWSSPVVKVGRPCQERGSPYVEKPRHVFPTPAAQAMHAAVTGGDQVRCSHVSRFDSDFESFAGTPQQRPRSMRPSWNTADQKADCSITELASRFPSSALETRVGGEARRLSAASGIIEAEFGIVLMLGDVLCLSDLHPLEPAIVAVDDIKTVLHLIHPERPDSPHARRSWMPVQCGELRDLARERSGNV